MTDISGKVVLISGASSGIGHATALLLASAGASVMLTARREKNLRQLRDEIEKNGGAADYRIVDVTNRSAFEEAARHTIQHYGKIDALFNNAGVMPLSYLRKLHVEEWERMIDVNIKGVLNGIAAVLPHFLERNEGHIINVSSVAGRVVFPGSAVYSGTKFAVRAITEGRQPVGLTSDWLLRHDLPSDWDRQRAIVATL